MRKTDFQERMRRTAAQYAPVLLILFLGAFLLSSMTLFGRRELATDDDARVKEAVELAPGALPGLTAEKLLREATRAYANAKYYRDDGYAEILYEREGERTTNSTRVACSLCFAKPNYVRMEFGRSLLRSDGKTIRAEILGDAFAGQIVERPAPMLLTSIREFYPDSEFAAAANLGTPPDVFWTSPQLILLFSRDPFKTLAPLNAKLKLLEPAYLRFEEDLEQEDVLCDRVEVDAGAGVRVYWFARATRALVRCELPAERLQAPVADARVVAVRVEFPRQILSQTSPCDASEFEFGADDDEVALRRVDHFEPPEVSALNQRFPLEALEGFDEGSDAVERQTTALCFWRADDDALNATFEEFAALADERPDARFYAANVDSDPAAEEFAREFFKDARVRSTRLDSSVFMRRAPDYPALVTPSLALLDASGRTLRFVCGSSDVGKLENAFGELDEGRDPRESEFNATYENARRFERFMESATTSELYRTTLETTRTLEAPPRQMTKTMRLHEVWRYDKLFSPCNPLAVSSASRTSDGQTWETRERRAGVLEDLLIVPCDGNALALLSPRGKLIRKTSPAAAAGEPITFVRSVEFGQDRRYYVASSSGVSRKLHRFDERFNDLGSLEVGQSADQRIGDARLADCDRDGIPELFLGVVAASDASAAATNGVYAIDMETRRVLWKDESVLTTTQIAVDRRGDDEECSPVCWALDVTKTKNGAVSAYDAVSGEPRTPPTVKEGETFRWFATTERVPEDGARFAAIVVDDRTDVTYFVGFDANGNERWRSVIPPMKDGIVEPLRSGDLDGDGYDEWLVASANGVVRFFNALGAQIDEFQYGAEITGLCVARWNNVSYLIITESTRTSAWRVDKVKR